MMLSLSTNSIRAELKKKSARSLSLPDLPAYAVEQFGLHAITLLTDQLKGLTPDDLAKLRDSGDRAGCACLCLSQTEALALGESKEAQREEAVQRMGRVLHAASLLGCNSVSLPIKGKDTDETFDRAAASMKRVLEGADQREINVLIAPAKGLTEDPERLTELVKAIGGFRIGTMPDFETAAASGDPVSYLKKLTPYATVVNASTLAFKEGTPAEDDGDTDSAEDDLPGGLDELAAELESMMDAPPPEHVGFNLVEQVHAIAAVGFDGNVAIDFRGDGDPALGVLHAKDAIEAALQSAGE